MHTPESALFELTYSKEIHGFFVLPSQWNRILLVATLFLKLFSYDFLITKMRRFSCGIVSPLNTHIPLLVQGHWLRFFKLYRFRYLIGATMENRLTPYRSIFGHKLNVFNSRASCLHALQLRFQENDFFKTKKCPKSKAPKRISIKLASNILFENRYFLNKIEWLYPWGSYLI